MAPETSRQRAKKSPSVRSLSCRPQEFEEADFEGQGLMDVAGQRVTDLFDRVERNNAQQAVLVPFRVN